MSDRDIGLLCVLALALILFGFVHLDQMATDTKCNACFSEWNTQHNEHVLMAVSNQPIYNGEFSLCQNACTSSLERQLEVHE